MSAIPNITYMYENEYKTEMASLIAKNYENKTELKLHEYSDAYILPTKYDSKNANPVWGRGGDGK